jgi:hypothetical protein
VRRVLPGDVSAAGCALLAVPAASRPALLSRLLAETAAADRYRISTGRAHPLWGNGSLGAAALTRPRVCEPYLDDADYAACLALVFDRLAGLGR